jgi:SAM-dependent methyltransferase
LLANTFGPLAGVGYQLTPLDFIERSCRTSGPNIGRGRSTNIVLDMNEAHEMCGSAEWRQMIRDVILPWALGKVDLGDDVLEVGPGYGATTDVLSTLTARLTSVEIDAELATLLRQRFAQTSSVQIVDGDATDLPYSDETFTGAASFTMLHHVPTPALQDQLFAEVARVLRPGAALVASDSLGSDALAGMHDGDTYNPVDPSSLPTRLAAAGFTGVEVKTNEFGWAAVARKS